jgi:hypothetical protein
MLMMQRNETSNLSYLLMLIGKKFDIAGLVSSRILQKEESLYLVNGFIANCLETAGMVPENSSFAILIQLKFQICTDTNGRAV